MQPRALKRLMQLSLEKRRDAISKGLGLLVENVETLSTDLELLRESERGRGLWILAGQAEEEAAKALVLLDLARMDHRDHQGMVRQIGNFYDHLARCIYAEVTHMNPADFAEVRRMVDSMRRSHYLDGPNKIDWIFRNPLLAAREKRLYVDYVHEQDGDCWVTPAGRDRILFGGPSPALRELVGSLHRVGVTSQRGLAIAADVWADIEITNETHWQEVVAANRTVLGALAENSAGGTETSPADAQRVVSGWGFPLSGLELGEIEVSLGDLEAEQRRWPFAELSPYD